MARSPSETVATLSPWLRKSPRPGGAARVTRPTGNPRGARGIAKGGRRVAHEDRGQGRGEDAARASAHFTTWSDIDVPDVLTPRRRPHPLPARPRACPGNSRSRAACSRRCTAAASGRCACSPASARPSRPTSASSTCSRRADRPLHRLRFPALDGLRLRPPRVARRGRHVRRRGRHAARHGGPLRGHPARPGHHVDDHQRPGDRAARVLRRARRRSAASRGTSIGGTIQNDCLKEFIAQNAWLVPPRPAMRIVTDMIEFSHARGPALEHRQHQRLPHPRGRSDGGAGARLHPRRRHRLRAGVRRPRARRRRLRAAALASSSTCTTTSSRRSPSSARRGACGRAS